MDVKEGEGRGYDEGGGGNGGGGCGYGELERFFDGLETGCVKLFMFHSK